MLMGIDYWDAGQRVPNLERGGKQTKVMKHNRRTAPRLILPPFRIAACEAVEVEVLSTDPTDDEIANACREPSERRVSFGTGLKRLSANRRFRCARSGLASATCSAWSQSPSLQGADLAGHAHRG
jgi:hypothetical protein